MTDAESPRPTIVVAGATSTAASRLPDTLGDRAELVGLSRRPEAVRDDRWAEWRRCDLFSSTETEAALQGADAVVYLAHSARPSARLSQASITDLDVLCADNLAHAAATHGAEHIVHVSTILQETAAHETAPVTATVSETLQSTGVPVTTLDTDLVVGSRGTTSTILRRLVERMPILICPRWTDIPLRLVEAGDLAAAVAEVWNDASSFGETREISPALRVTYRQMLEATADLLDRRRWFVSLPLHAVLLSAVTTATVVGQPTRFVRRFLDELEGLSRGTTLPAAPDSPPPELADLLERAFRAPDSEPDRLPARTDEDRHLPRSVRSVQRLPAPAHHDASWAVEEFLRWLGASLGPLLTADIDEARVCRFYVPLVSAPALILEYLPAASRPDRQVFRIAGGFLAASDDAGEFEFRLLRDRDALFTSIHDFQPALPWLLYVWTQALVHLRVMRRFGRHLSALDGD